MSDKLIKDKIIVEDTLKDNAEDAEQIKYLKTALLAGEISLGNGAETSRCEEVMKYILEKSDEEYATSVISTSLFARVGNHSGLNTIKKWDTDLNKVCMVNDVSRRLTSDDINIDEAYVELEAVKKKSIYRFYHLLIAYTMTAALLPVFVSNNPYDCIAGAVCGVVMAFANAFFKKVRIRYFIVILLQSIILVLTTHLAAVISGGAVNIDVVIAASLAPMLPGLALTNAVRDILQGDYVSGAGRLLEAIIRCLSIVLGVVAGLMIGRSFNIEAEAVAGGSYTFASGSIMLIVGALLTALGYCIMMEVPPKYVILSALVGGAGRIVYLILVAFGMSSVLATLIATAVITLLAHLISKRVKAPTILFLISGIMSLVPGTFLYTSIRKFVAGDYVTGSNMLVETLMIAGAIALGIFLVDTVVNAITMAKRHELIEK